MSYALVPVPKEEIRFVFRVSDEAAERRGAIGHMRADFGKSGYEFWSTWFDNQVHLKTSDFKQKFDEVINALRDDRPQPPFASRHNLEAFCAVHPSKSAFKIATLDYSFYFRLQPQKGAYNFYCFAYDNRYLLPELAGKHELPNDCFGIMPSSGDLVFIVRGENGYYPSGKSTTDPEMNRQIEVATNALLGVTRQQAEAMLAGSLFGWSTPAAKPWNYDQNGNPRSQRPKRNGPER